jgi:hypothetical protein
MFNLEFYRICIRNFNKELKPFERKSDGIMGILGINAIFPFAGPVTMTASKILFLNDFICNLVPLHKFGG